MTFRARLSLLLALAAWLTATDAAATEPEAWTSRFGRDRPLVGQIWDVNRRTAIDKVILEQRLADADFVLLGEKHDNPDHHRLQANLVAGMIRVGRRPAVAFEMLTPDQAPALAAYLRQHPGDAAGIGQAVNWSASGWPEWRLYRPIAAAALDGGVVIVAANLSQAEVAALRTGDFAAALGRQRAEALGLLQSMPAALQDQVTTELRQEHCGLLPAAALPAMLRIQRARDAVLAEALSEHGQTGGGILIAGAGHIRNDRAVPFYLHRLRPAAAVLSLAFIEAHDGATVPNWASLPYDYVWFTPVVDDRDPCEKFKDQLQHMKRKD